MAEVKYMFQAGDKVEVKSNCSGSVTGKVYTLVKRLGNGSLCAFDEVKKAGCYCKTNWTLVSTKGGGNMKTIWEVIVVDKEKDTIVVREIVIDGDEKSACSKVSIAFASKLKDLVFDNLAYVTKQLGSYESKNKK